MNREDDEQEDDLPPPPECLNLLKATQTGPKQDHKEQDLKLDQSSGRVGDPLGLSPGSGSSQLPEVKVLHKIHNVDEALFPPMNHEELELLDSMMLDAGKVLTGQSDQRDQRDQQEKGEQPNQHQLQLPGL